MLVSPPKMSGRIAVPSPAEAECCSAVAPLDPPTPPLPPPSPLLLLLAHLTVTEGTSTACRPERWQLLAAHTALGSPFQGGSWCEDGGVHQP